MEIAYLAQTEWSTLLLDAEGVCVQARSRSGKKASTDGAARCIGAQYVASLDRGTAGCLIEMPRIGCPMVFAATTTDGRIYLVRTGPVIHFEEVSSGVHDRGALPLQERARTDERVVFRERVPDDQEMTTPFRKAAAAKRAQPSAARLPEPEQPERLPSRGGLPLPPPTIRQAYLPPPAPPRQSPQHQHGGRHGGHGGHAEHPPARERERASSTRTSVPPPPRRGREVDTQQEIVVAPPGERMWSLPDEDLQSDKGPSPISAPYHLKRPGHGREPAPPHWQAQPAQPQRTSRRR